MSPEAQDVPLFRRPTARDGLVSPEAQDVPLFRRLAYRHSVQTEAENRPGPLEMASPLAESVSRHV